MSNVIRPTVGRKVWYRPSAAELATNPGVSTIGDQPLDATVVAVFSDRLVNLVIFDAAGEKHVRHSVQLVQDGDVANTRLSVGYAEWMPFQAKAAAREPALDALTAPVTRHPLHASIVPLDNNGVAISGDNVTISAPSVTVTGTITPIHTPPAPMV